MLLRTAAVATTGFVVCALVVWAFSLMVLGAVIVYTFLAVMVGTYLKTRSAPIGLHTWDGTEGTAPTEDPARAIVDGLTQEVDGLRAELRTAHDALAEFVPQASHFHEQCRCADGQALFTFQWTYVKTVQFRDWSDAQHAVGQFRKDVVAHRIAQTTIDRAHGRRTLA